MNDVALWRRLLAEFLGSAFLAAVVIGSGIAAQRLSPGETGLELLENAVATAAGLFAIILMFGPVSGAHFNPVVSFVDAAFGGLPWRDAAAYLPAQVAGCISGAVAANLMFAQAAVSISTKHRATPAHFLSEVIATLGLILVIFALARSGRSRSAPAAVGAYIGAAYFFTSSTSFANPAITIGRMFSDTFAGIAPSSAPAFIAAQILGGALAVVIIRALYPRLTPAQAADIIVPHHLTRPEDARASHDGALRRPARPRAWASPTDQPQRGDVAMHLVMIGGSDAGISAALRARELDPGAEVSVVVADAYPNFSICGIPYYISGEVTPWRNLAHRTVADLEATGMSLRLDTTARRIDVAGRKLLVTAADGTEELISYDKLVVGTGAVPVRPPITGLAELGPADGVHLLHSMGDTFALMRTLEETAPASAVIVGAGYIGLEMADALTTRGLRVVQMEQLPEVLPTVDPSLGAQVHAQLTGHGAEVLTGTTVKRISRAAPGQAGRLAVEAPPADGTVVTRLAGPGPGRRRGAPRHRPRGGGRGHARGQGRDRGGPGHADRPAGRLRRRGLRGHASPAARRDLPAARHHRTQAGPGRRRERPRRQPGVRRQPRHPGGEDLRPRRRAHRLARPRSHRRRVRPGHRRLRGR